ncbi:MAG: hypothetical protein A3H91_07615 [Gammaproteobacteria bacterium RIFCSPLOWO2_02_FULL_61_13]|nr:MAG: hypothetical protein A3H91_07615 [Gammaproteobacteria bacterium RIFCSPLOWO2_02_FULL_61_13]
MPSMTACNFGDIVLVPFPFTDQTTSKQRPAVIISSDAYHRVRPDVILMAVTSHVQTGAGLGETGVQDWKNAGLLKPSVIKPVIATVERRLVIKRLGQLTKTDLAGLRKVLALILGSEP